LRAVAPPQRSVPVKHSFVLLFATALACCLISPARAVKVPVFDDFSGTEIDSEKWRETEATRLVDSGGRLVLGRATSGGTSSDSGSVVENFVLTATDSAPARGLAATITVVAVSPADPCVANPRPSSSSANVTGMFFSTRPGGGIPGDQTGDVIGNAYVHADAGPTPLNVYGGVFRCLNSNCSTIETIGFVNMGTVGLGQPVSLEVTWDPPNQRFRFTRDKNPPLSAPYTVPVNGAPSFQFNNLNIRNEVANCQAGKLKAGMTAQFDEMRIGH